MAKRIGCTVAMIDLQNWDFSSFDGVALKIHELGKGSPVILLHGLFSNAHTNWIKFGHAQALADAGFRVYMPLLLGKADDVSDVLAVEKELTRVQSEIESMQARFDRLKSEIELSVLTVTLERERILGPLGYIGYGVWWAFSKLFIVR